MEVSFSLKDKEQKVSNFSVKEEEKIKSYFSIQNTDNKIIANFCLEDKEQLESSFSLKEQKKINSILKIETSTREHNLLYGRSDEDCHPIGSITGLIEELNGKLDKDIKYGSSLELNINEQTYVLTAVLKDQNGNNLGTAQTVDLPLETMVVGAEYDETTKELVLILKNGETVRFSIADLVSGLQPTIPDLAEIRDGASKGETAVQPSELDNYATKQELNGKQDIISDLSAIRTGAEKGETAVQPNQLSAVATSGSYNDLTNKPTIPTQTSQLTNNSDFTTKAYVDGLVGDIETALNNINSGG